MDLKLLRDATRPEHEATEAVVPLTKPDLTREEYVAVLQRFHTVVATWDSFATAHAPVTLAELVGARRRAAALESDLAFFGQSTVPGVISTHLLQQMRDLTEADSGNPSRFLGAMYVLEGSTLGGRYIAAHVEAVLGLKPGEGDRFFRGYGERTMPMWREFQQVLLAIPDAESDAVIDAARRMFALFQQTLAPAEQAPTH